MRRDPDVAPSYGNRRRRCTSVEHGNRDRTVGEGARPDLDVTRCRYATALPSCTVLIDCNDFAVRENIVNRESHRSQVVAGEQRRSENRPQAHVRAILVVSHRTVSDLEHVGIVPMSGPRVGPERVLTEANARHGIPGIADVAGRAPQVSTDVRSPLPDG